VFTEAEARQIQERFGPAFKKVIAKIDELSGIDKEAIEPPSSAFRIAELARRGHTRLMELPPGVADPIFLCELALELKMPVGELAERMSAHELTVVWPAFFRHKSARG
jgi:hypothetical protein